MRGVIGKVRYTAFVHVHEAERFMVLFLLGALHKTLHFMYTDKLIGLIKRDGF
jgi:hypothetical protein